MSAPTLVARPNPGALPVASLPGLLRRDDVEDRAGPEGWIHVTTARDAIRLLETGRVVELLLDHDLGDDEGAGRGIDVIDFLDPMER